MDDTETDDRLDSEVEQDCWPSSRGGSEVALPTKFEILQSDYSRLKNAAGHAKQADNWCDSGCDNFDSTGLLSDTTENRPENNPEFGIDVDDHFKKLSIGIRQTKCIHSKLDSVDDGYHTQSLTSCESNISSVSDNTNRSEFRSTTSDAEVRTNQILEIFHQDEDGDTQLHTSIIQLLKDVAVYFISKAPDSRFLNIYNNYLQTPLHLAVITKQPVLARKLITAGAQIDVHDHKGNTPLHIASKEGCALIAKVLLEPIRRSETEGNAYETPYHRIPQNLNARNYDGQLCIHLAAEGTHLDVLAVLLENGADINARDGKSGRTILHYAAESGNLSLLNFLFRYRTLDVNAVTYGGLTPLLLAKGRDHDDIAKLLRTAGAQDESSDSEEEMMDDCYNDIKIAGHPVMNGPC